MKKCIVFVFIMFLFPLQMLAKEGMWLPVLLEKYNISEMQEMGFKLSAQDIYDVNNASMKDAVLMFGRGCTGELISNEGLIITNYHCGYGQIQRHSTLENDFLQDGFWALNKGEELSNPGLTVSFLEYMKDVTAEVLNNTNNLTAEEKKKTIEKNSQKIKKDASGDGKYKTDIKPLFYGNQYFLYVYKVYKDVRLVGAPPSAIGKFGGDTDNWMWPRHTGDFSLFRIYADENNEPAEYSPDNVPYQPKKFFPISLKGVQPDDFTMVFGNPGSTWQYVPSQEVDIIMNQRDPDRIKIRNKKMEVIGSAMEKSDKVRIQYAAKFQSVGNAWKKWQGEIKGLKRLNAVNKKLEFESDFKCWAEENKTWNTTYKPVFDSFDETYENYAEYIKASDYYSEIVLRGVEIFKMAQLANTIVNNLENDKPERVKNAKDLMIVAIESFFKDFDQQTDEQLFTELMPLLWNDLEPRFLPVEFNDLMNKYDSEQLVKKVVRKSVLINQKKFTELLKNGTDKQLLKLRKDPLVALVKSLNFQYDVNIKPVVDVLDSEIKENMKVYMAGIMEMKNNQSLYPDANLTLRITYGKVEGYKPKDGMAYKYYTTLSGIMEKSEQEIADYNIPARLKEMYSQKDFGRYEVNGDVPVAFTASNHTSGGNSGSPVVNANGELIGVNFDRCWEGTMSDVMFDPEMCRNISIDIRYALFIIDKFAGAGYLLDEMEIVE